MKLGLASDHGGFQLKQAVLQFLKRKKIEVLDLGNHGTESVDYPDYAIRVAELVSEGKIDAGLLMCGTGIGRCIVANKFKGVRAAVVEDTYTARMAKEHNNANILCLGGRVLDAKKGEEVIAAWLEARYEGGRHDRRLEKIREIEKRHLK